MCPTVIYQSDLDCADRINDRLKPYPSNGQTPDATVTTVPTRCVTKVYYGSTQAKQPAPPANPQDPFNQVPTGGYGSNLYNYD
jgi:hypothetical protein